jgi:hypothetical protein
MVRELDTPVWLVLCVSWCFLCLWSASRQYGQLQDVSCPSWKVTRGTKFAIWPKMTHILPEFKMYLASQSSRDLFLPVLTLVGRSIKSSSGCYLGPNNYISLLSGIKIKELIWETRSVWQRILTVESERNAIRGEARAIALQLKSAVAWGLCGFMWIEPDWWKKPGCFSKWPYGN